MKKIDPYGIKNVNFTLNIEDREQRKEFKRQRLERGFDDSETWSLDHTLASFLAPRLRRFRELTTGVPAWLCDPNKTVDEGMKEWHAILDEMIWCCEFYATCDDDPVFWNKTPDERKAIDERLNKGFELIGKYWRCLWW